MVTQGGPWYVQKGSRVQGPFTAEEVGRFLLLGRVRNTDRVSRDGELWEPVTQVPELIPEELLDLGSEQGWQQYLGVHAMHDERHSDVAERPFVERRAITPPSAPERVRDEWLAVPPPQPLASRMLPWSLLGITLVALLVVIWLNTTTGATV